MCELCSICLKYFVSVARVHSYLGRLWDIVSFYVRSVELIEVTLLIPFFRFYKAIPWIFCKFALINKQQYEENTRFTNTFKGTAEG